MAQVTWPSERRVNASMQRARALQARELQRLGTAILDGIKRVLARVLYLPFVADRNAA